MHPMPFGRPEASSRRLALILAAVALILAFALAAGSVDPAATEAKPLKSAKAKAKKKAKAKAKAKAKRKAAAKRRAAAKRKALRERGKVRVMTRNIFLGGDIGHPVRATDSADFFKRNGELLKQVDSTNFAERAKGLATEIQRMKPDLIGLQEAALWRTAAPNLNVLQTGPEATTVKYDFLQMLLAAVNKGKAKYGLANVQQEFDFEAPANYGQDYPDINGRLTMRDAILFKRGSGIKIRKKQGANYQNLLHLQVSGVPVTVQRGWLSIEAKVRKSPWFRFTNTHLESMDDRKVKPSLRAQQATELAQLLAGSKIPSVALGDFNSDSPGLVDGDQQAYEALIGFGWKDIGTQKPMSCCIESSDDLRTGSAAEFDHRVDQIFTNTPRKVKRLGTWVTGRQKGASGWWNSDHAGVTSQLRILP